MKRVLLILSLLLASVFTFLWIEALSIEFDNARHPAEGHSGIFFSTTPPRKPLWFERRYSVEFPPHGHIRLLLMSETSGFEFDVFTAQIPPERSPGPPGSDATQKWLQPGADRTAAAYSRHFGFEKGIVERHGQYGNDVIYFFGTDYYVAVPHVLLIFLFLLPACWLLVQRLKLKGKDKPRVPPSATSEPAATPL